MHTRIRKFNTRDTYPEQKLDNDLCQTVVARGSMVFVRGQIGQDLDSSASVGIGDAGAQAEQAMKNIALLLGEAGARLEHVCKITIYLTDPRYREAVYRVVGRWLKGVYPVSTGIVVSALARLDLDPWQEAIGLARMPRQQASARLAALLASFPKGPAIGVSPGALAGRLGCCVVETRIT